MPIPQVVSPLLVALEKTKWAGRLDEGVAYWMNRALYAETELDATKAMIDLHRKKCLGTVS